MTTPAHYGERKHETCRFGRLTEAWRGDGDPERMVPTVLPLCTWKAPEPRPPAVDRAWGGLVEFDRDCAVCLAHRGVGE